MSLTVSLSIHLHTNHCKLKTNVYWTHGVSMCGHVQTLFHRYDTLLVPCVCSSGASRIHDYGMPFHRFHSRIQQQDGITLQSIAYFPLSIRALKKRQSENEYSWQIYLTKISILMQQSYESDMPVCSTNVISESMMARTARTTNT